MAVVYAPNATQGARLVVDDVNCQAVCNPDGTPIGGGGGGNVTIVGPGTVTTPTKTTVNTNGTVLAGKTHVEFIASIDYVGTILGDATTGVPSANIPVSVLTLDAPPWAPLAAIPYTFSAGSLTIITSVTA